MKYVAVKPVLLTSAQMIELERIQVRERERSELGVAPTIHEIARGLMNKALREVRV